MELGLLGPVEAIVDGAPVHLGGRQRRTLFAVLAVHANTTVSTDRLIDELWGETPPSSARKTIQSHIAHLRKALNSETEALKASNGGYVLQAKPDSIDSNRFQRLMQEARDQRRASPAQAKQTLDKALALFRGSPLAGIEDDAFSLRVEASRLEELRLSAIEERLDAMLAVGVTADVATEAERLVARYPLRERLWGLLMTALYRSGRQAEALRAFSRARQIMADELGIEPSGYLTELEQQILQQESEVGGPYSAHPVPTGTPPTRNPYKGLRAFDETDARDFFGREELVRRLTERVDSLHRPRLTVLAGASGAGKSSVVRAGLIPELRDRNFSVAVMIPGRDPVASFARAISDELGRKVDGLSEVITASSELDELIVVVDQAEELFTAATDRDGAARLLDAITDVAVPLRWMLTIRADYLDRLLSHPRLGDQLQDALVLVPRLQDHEVAAAVRKPAHGVGLTVADDLTRKIIDDIQEEPSALPLLQYALTDTFDRRKSDTLTLADFELAGGISGALSRRADEQFRVLDERRQEIARKVFLTLVTVTADDDIVRRRVSKADLSVLAEPAVVDGIIERFSELRLLVFDQDPETGEPTVEIAHEALFRQWPQLSAWIDESRDDLRMRRRLEAAASEWEDARRDSDFLLTGGRLAEFLAWQQRSDLVLDDNEFLSLSDERAATSARRRRARRVALAATLAAAAVVAGALAIESNRQANLASVRELVAASGANVSTDPDLALLLALEAHARGTDVAAPEIAEALHAAIQAQRAIQIRPSEGASFLSPDGTMFIGAVEAEVTVYEVASGDAVLHLQGHDDIVFNAVWSNDGRLIGTNSLDGTTRVWDAETGAELWAIESESQPISIAFSPDSSYLATSYSFLSIDLEGNCSDCTLRVWDLKRMELANEFAMSCPIGINFTPDGLLGAANGSCGETSESEGITIVDIDSGDTVVEFPPPEASGFTDVAFAADNIMAAAGDDVIIADISSGETLATVSGSPGGGGQAVDISRDGELLAVGNALGEVIVYDRSGSHLLTLKGHSGAVLNVALSDDGDLVTSGGEDGTVRVWDATLGATGEHLTLGAADRLRFSSDGVSLATGGLTPKVWDPGTGVVRISLSPLEPASFVLGAEFTADGSHIATFGFEEQQPRMSYRVHSAVDGSQLAALVVEGLVSDPGLDPTAEILAVGVGPDIRLWSYGDDTYPGEISGAHNPSSRNDRPAIMDVSYSPDGSRLASVGSDGWVRVWSTGDLSLIWEDHGHPAAIDPGAWQLDFSPEGDRLVTLGIAGQLIVWDVSSGERLVDAETAGGEMTSVAFGPIGAILATAGIDGRVEVWDAEGRWSYVVARHAAPVWGLDFSPDGRLLAVGTAVGSPLYIVDSDELIDLALSRLTRWWSIDECRRLLHTDSCPVDPRQAGDG